MIGVSLAFFSKKERVGGSGSGSWKNGSDGSGFRFGSCAILLFYGIGATGSGVLDLVHITAQFLFTINRVTDSKSLWIFFKSFLQLKLHHVSDFRTTFDHDKGQKSAISGRRLHWVC